MVMHDAALVKVTTCTVQRMLVCYAISVIQLIIVLSIKYRLDDGFEVSTGFRSPRKPMYRRPERAARGRLFRFPR